MNETGVADSLGEAARRRGVFHQHAKGNSLRKQLTKRLLRLLHIFPFGAGKNHDGYLWMGFL